MNKVPSSQIARASVVGSTAVKLGVGKLKNKVKRPFLDVQEKGEHQDQLEDEEAEILFKAITQLRGTAVKLAQALGMESDLLSERLKEELAKSYHQVPPLNRVLVQKVITKEFGKSISDVFEKFDTTAMAAASLGQVHRAEVGSAQVVAVKIQYPGIHVSIDSDLKLLRKLANSSRQLIPAERRPKKDVLDATIKEIGERLMEETNYTLEAENTHWFKEHLVIEGIELPRVYNDYCTERVITTQMLEGLHLDAWLANNPAQEERNKAGQLIYDLFVHSTMQLGRVHADPNPGNYLFKNNGEIALIDFGCVKKLSSQFTENLPLLMHAFALNDQEKIIQAYANVGMSMENDNSRSYELVLKPFGEWLSRPFKEEYFEFSEKGDYTKEGLSLLKEMAEIPQFESIKDEFIFFDRTMYGMFKIFEKLGAKVYIRKHWERLWDA